MNSVRPLNEDEVFNEMKKMVAFIKQEAYEKTREIRVKADEEFNIEKAKIVRQESLNIEATFERKMKQAEVQKRIAQSNHINKARLRILQERQNTLNQLYEAANARIHDASKGEQYDSLLEQLILQGAYTLLEPAISVQCRQQDVKKAQFAAEKAAQLYEDKLHRKVKITVSDTHLPASSAGGVLLSGYEGRIKVDNTLEARLDTCKEEMLPQLRVILFGHSPNRKFFD